MTLNQMRYFYEVCRLQNTTKASQILHVSQPTVSIAIRELEEETKLNLFHRQGKKIVITQDGYKLFVKISNILSQIKELDDEISIMSNRRNHVRLAIPIQIGTIFLPRILEEFKNKYPNINFDIIETGGIGSLTLLENDKIDIAITNYQAEHKNKFDYFKLFTSECCFCTHKDNPLAKRESLTANDIAYEKIVMLDSSFFIHKLINDFYNMNKITPRVIYYSPHLHSIKNLVKNKVASTFLLNQVIFPEDNIVPIRIENPIFIDSGIVIKKGKQLYSDELLLIEYLKKISVKLPKGA